MAAIKETLAAIKETVAAIKETVALYGTHGRPKLNTSLTEAKRTFLQTFTNENPSPFVDGGFGDGGWSLSLFLISD